MKRYIICRRFVIAFALGILLTSTYCARVQEQNEVNNLYGNTVYNLQNGGSMTEQNNNIFFAYKGGRKNKLLTYDKSSSKMSTLKTFISIPSELSSYDKYLFYKKDIAMLSASGIYRLNSKTKVEKEIIKQPVDKYMIYDKHIYYTISSESDDKGLYRSDIDGKNETLLITGEISEFVIDENNVYYITENKIKHYNITDGKKEDIISGENGKGYYDLNFYEGMLYFVSYNLCDTLGDQVYKYDVLNDKITNILKGTKASIRFVDGVSLIFENEDGFYSVNIENSSQTLFLDEFLIDEIYFFDEDVYFYTTNVDGIMELWHSNLMESIIEKIY